MTNKIYIIEDDTSISTLLKDYINRYGFDGFYWCTKIIRKSNTPIIFISARESGMDQIIVKIIYIIHR